MTFEQLLQDKLRSLSPKKQQEVLAFVESLKSGEKVNGRKSLQGLWADLDLDLDEKDIADVRREMWQDFPRDPS
ncbi:MAG: hypothetical protein HYX26_03895 [Acidobacteriales bacterium]|nr:hypothetical protein [Terriglobales bacterium]